MDIFEKSDRTVVWNAEERAENNRVQSALSVAIDSRDEPEADRLHAIVVECVRGGQPQVGSDKGAGVLGLMILEYILS